MLHLLIHIKLGYTWEKACVFLSMVAWKSPLLCAWEMGGSRVNMLDRLCSQECKRGWAGTRVCRILQ